MVKVVKFGGSSLASAEQFAKVGDIIRADETRKYVVPSAPGKRNSKDTKVTDMLYACYALAEAGEDFRVALMKIKDRYDSIINGLQLTLSPRGIQDNQCTVQGEGRYRLCGFPWRVSEWYYYGEVPRL